MISTKLLIKKKEKVQQVSNNTIGFKKEFNIGFVDNNEIWRKNEEWKVDGDL